jgi:hypothetical protein
MKTVVGRGARIAFVLCGLAGAAGFAQAESDDSPSPCASITDDKSRLQCYDAEQALRKSRNARQGAPAQSPGSQPPAAPAAAPAATTPAAAADVSQPAPAAATAPAPGAAEAASASAAQTRGSANADFGSETLPKKGRSGSAGEAIEITAKVTAVAGRRKGDYAGQRSGVGGNPAHRRRAAAARRDGHPPARRAGLVLPVSRIRARVASDAGQVGPRCARHAQRAGSVRC